MESPAECSPLFQARRKKLGLLTDISRIAVAVATIGIIVLAVLIGTFYVTRVAFQIRDDVANDLNRRSIMLSVQARELWALALSSSMGLDSLGARNSPAAKGIGTAPFFDCGAGATPNMQLLSRHYVGDLNNAQISTSTAACLMEKLRSAFVSHGPGGIQRLSLILPGGALTYPSFFATDAIDTDQIIDSIPTLRERIRHHEKGESGRFFVFIPPYKSVFDRSHSVISYAIIRIVDGEWQSIAVSEANTENIFSLAQATRYGINDVVITTPENDIVAYSHSYMPSRQGLYTRIISEMDIDSAPSWEIKDGLLVTSSPLVDSGGWRITNLTPIESMAWVVLEISVGPLLGLVGIISLICTLFYLYTRYVVAPTMKLERDFSLTSTHLKISVETMSDGMCLIDSRGRLLRCNSKFLDMLSYKVSDISPGMEMWSILLRSPGLALDTDVTGKFITDLKIFETMGMNFQTVDDRWLEMRVDVSKDLETAVVTLTDVTADRESTIGLIHARQAAEQAFAKLQQTQSYIIEQEKMAALGTLVAGISHEVKTPLGVAITAASVIEQRTNKVTAEFKNATLTREAFGKYIDAVDTVSKAIGENLQRAVDLVGSFKQISVDQTSGDCRRISVSKYMSDIIASLQPQVGHHGHKVTLVNDSNLEIETRPSHLWQVVSNLVLNACIHAFPSGTKGLITVGVQEKGSHLEITIEDNGQGMSQETTKRIFEPFFTTRRGSGGTGLGLTIVHNLVVNIFGGNIRCESTQGVGTRFTVAIPKDTRCRDISAAQGHVPHLVMQD